MSAPDGTWWCEAYGPPPADDGSVWSDDATWPRCFVSSDPAVRRCATQDVCADVMASERRRVFARINEGAVDGDEVLSFLAEEFPTPGTLLGGPDPADPPAAGGAR